MHRVPGDEASFAGGNSLIFACSGSLLAERNGFFSFIPALLGFDRDLSPAVMFINFLKAMLRVTIVFSNFSNLQFSQKPQGQ